MTQKCTSTIRLSPSILTYLVHHFSILFNVDELLRYKAVAQQQTLMSFILLLKVN